MFTWLISRWISSVIFIHFPSGDSFKACCCCLITKSCLTLCDPVGYSTPGSSVHGIFQARILEWVAMLSSRGSSQPRDWNNTSCISCTGRQILYPLSHQGSPIWSTVTRNITGAESNWNSPLCTVKMAQSPNRSVEARLEVDFRKWTSCPLYSWLFFSH